MSESASKLIDRLVLGLPPPDVLIARVEAMLREGWTKAEVARMFGLTVDTLSQRISRHRRRRAC